MEKQKLRWISSWDDGHELDIQLAKLLKEFGLPGIFFVPTRCGMSPAQLLDIARDFEIGGHTVSHPQDLKLLGDDELRGEILNNKRYLENATGQKITKFCYPRGRYDERVVRAVRDAGFESARTTIVLKTKSDDPFKTDTTIHVFPRDEYHNHRWDNMAREYAERASRLGGYFHIWGHSLEISRIQGWEALREFFKWLTNNFEIVKA